MFRGAWNSGTSYVLDDLVYRNGSGWIALRANQNVTPLAGADWSLLVLQGAIGLTGPKGDPGGGSGIGFRGNWSSLINYTTNESVVFLGSAWIARRNNQNVTPVEGLDWTVLAQQGDPGAQGPQGPQGIQGNVGPQGSKGIVFKGSWSSSANYVTDDAVLQGGSAWLARRSNQNVTPVEGADWTQLVQQGDTGSAGPQGVTGAQGPVGPTGPKGDKGNTGTAGPVGPIGATGPQGAKGIAFRGAWGSAISYVADDAVAHQGSAWLAKRANQNVPPVEGADWTELVQKGDTGSAGPQGVTGAQGSVGPVGPKGDKGDTGTAGPVGPIGATGPQGQKGIAFRGAWGSAIGYIVDDAVAHQGSAWLAKRASQNVAPVEGDDWTLLAQKGDPGPQGPQGSVGPQGATGPVGPQGSAGVVGPKGATGSTGSQGPVGVAGPVGPRGLTFQGEWSSSANYAANDAVSHQGSAWLAKRANQNISPVEGADWTLLAAKGDTGPQGQQGVVGAQGSAGPTGPQGSKGDTGPVGPVGVTGTPGPIGAQGPKGLMFRGAWNSGTSYVLDDLVYRNGSGWIALRASQNVTPVAGADWSLLVLQGAPGLIGPKGDPGGGSGIGFRGNWTSVINYTTNESVVFQGSAWIARRNNQNVSPVEGLDWTVLAQQGDPGAQGPQGPPGIQGNVGPQGSKGIVFKGSWSSSANYLADDAVINSGSAWLARRSNQNVTPVEGADWTQLVQKGDTGSAGPQGITGAQGPVGSAGAKGDKGDTGTAGPVGPIGAIGPQGLKGIAFRGAWGSAISYVADDAVAHQGSAWLAKRANQNVPPVEGADWTLLAQKGDTGPQGPQGNVGPIGPTGPQGIKGDTGATGPAGTTTADGLVSGTLADTRLSANVVLLNRHQIFTGSNAFSGVVNATNSANRFGGAFSGNGAGLTNLAASAVGGQLSAASIPALDAAIITSGIISVNRVPNLNATHINAGVFAVARIPDLDAAKIGSGTLADARLDAGIARVTAVDAGLMNVSNTLSGRLLGTNTALTGVINAETGARIAAIAQAINDLLAGTNQWSGSNTFAGVARLTNVNNQVNGTFTGNGGGLTNLAAANVNGTLATTNIPDLDAAKLTSGTLNTARIPSLDAAQIGNGTLADARLDAGIARVTAVDAGLLNVSNTLSGRLLGTNTALTGVINAETGARITAIAQAINDLLTGTNQWSGSNTYAGVLRATNVNNQVNGAFTGNGGGLTNLSAGAVGGLLSVASIPALDAAIITSGTLSVNRIPDLDATKIVSGTFASARIPSLDASIIGSGTLVDARLGSAIARTTDLNGASNSLSGRIVSTNDSLVTQLAGLNTTLSTRIDTLSNEVANARLASLTAVSIDSADTNLTGLGYQSFSTIASSPWSNGSTTDAPGARSGQSGIWTGTDFILWGGLSSGGTHLDAGAKYDPVEDAWSAVSPIDVPAARSQHSAIWSGQEMIVWGGLSAVGRLNSGGRFNPTNSVWVPTTTTGAPSARNGHVSIWTGSRMVTWGGINTGGLLNDGGNYDPAANTWASVITNGAPAARSGTTVVWTGDKMIVWGGEGVGGELNTGGRLVFSNPETPSSWQTIATTGAPSARKGHSAIWTGTRMIIWGGGQGGTVLADGATYDPAADAWSAISTNGAPSARSGHSALWTGTEMLIFGGSIASGETATGFAYNPATDQWRALSTAGNPTARTGASSVWTGTELLTFGGTAGGSPVASLQRLNPQPTFYFYRKP